MFCSSTPLPHNFSMATLQMLTSRVGQPQFEEHLVFVSGGLYVKPHRVTLAALNKFSDLSRQEFRQKYLMQKNATLASRHGDPPLSRCAVMSICSIILHPQQTLPISILHTCARSGGQGRRRLSSAEKRHLLQSTPDVVNWTAAGKTTAVRDQGDCASCWAFSGTSAIESALLIQAGLLANKTSLVLSTQEAVSNMSSACDASMMTMCAW